MANPHLQPLLKLTTAVANCRNHGKLCLWHTDGLPIKIDVTIPKGSIVAKTSVLVTDNEDCLVMLICISTFEKKATIIGLENFSGLNSLKAHHPQLFEVLGTVAMI